MSARQNKKQRKGRNNPNNRERTVTTLTEDPNSSYLIPLPSEEPPGALMSSPFSIASSAGNGPSSSAYQPPSSYEAYGFTNFSTQTQVSSQQAQQQPQQQASSIPGKNDLERLENLKNIIKANQHASYRPIAQPAALAALYLGSLPPSQSEPNTNGSSQATGSGPSSPVDNGRRPPRLQSKDWENAARGKSTTINGSQPTNNVLSDSSPVSAPLLTSSPSFSFSTQTNSPIQSYGGRFSQGTSTPSAIDTSNIQGSVKTNSAGPLSAEPKSVDVHMSDAQAEVSGPSVRFESGGARTASSNAEPARIPDDTGYGAPRGPGITDKSSFDGKDDLRTPRDSSWTVRNGPPPDDRRRDLVDRPPPSPRPVLNGSGGGSDARSNLSDRPLVPRDPLPPRDDRFYDRERERDRERYDRDRRDWDRDRRSSYDRFRPPLDVARRPPPEQRHYEPEYSDRGPPRRYDIVKEEPISDARRLADLRQHIPDGRPPVRPEDDRLPLITRFPPSSGDSRVPPVDVSRPLHPDPRALVPPQRAPSPDNRPVRTTAFDARPVKSVTIPEERRVVPVPPDVRAPPSSVRPADIPGSTRPIDRERERTVPLTPVDAPRPSIPLEERISRPSLQERISSAQPELLSQVPPLPASRSEPRRPLEERLSAIPVSVDSREQRGRIPDRAERPPAPAPAPPTRPPPSRPPQPVDDQIASRPPPVSVQDERRIDDRPGRYPRSPPGDRSTYPSAREDPHSVNKGVPSHSGIRDYRSISRERSAPSYRPDERNYITDDRRIDAMDVDTPSRYNDSRSIQYNRPFSPPSAADLARDRARAASQYPPSPSRPPPSHDAHPYDDDRRYPPSSRDWAPSYHGDRRREWSTADEEYYKRQWDRNAPPPPAAPAPERERYEREPPPPAVRNSGWETRDERERSNYPPPRAPSPSRPYDGHQRSLSSRLTDTYSSSAPGAPLSDRSFAPRDAPPPFSRVRQRSLSPPARRPGAPVIDETRPPAKRTREDGYGAGEYYPPSTAPSVRDPGVALRRQETYPPLPTAVNPAAPPAAGNAYFDNRAPPPAASTAVSGGDREYPPREYSVQSYERQRSPPRGATYSRGGYSRDTRDDRRYPPPPPPPTMLPPRRP